MSGAVVLAGYHLRDIERGTFGEASKIVEEVNEFADALEQGCKLMALQELSDLVGAVEAYLQNYHPEIALEDLVKMADITKRAFDSGHRS